jgi:hypothetical protein
MVARYGILMYDVAYVGVRTNHIRLSTVRNAYVYVMHT